MNENSRRVAAVLEHPDYMQLRRHSPGAARYYLGALVLAVFGLIFAGVGVAMSLFVLETFGGPTALIPLVFSVVGVGVFVFSSVRFVRIMSSALERLPALVVDKRLAVSGGAGTSAASTRYYVTLEFSDGERRELQATGRLYGALGPDDVGVAYTRYRYLLDYRRLSV